MLGGCGKSFRLLDREGSEAPQAKSFCTRRLVYAFYRCTCTACNATCHGMLLHVTEKAVTCYCVLSHALLCTERERERAVTCYGVLSCHRAGIAALPNRYSVSAEPPPALLFSQRKKAVTCYCVLALLSVALLCRERESCHMLRCPRVALMCSAVQSGTAVTCYGVLAVL